MKQNEIKFKSRSKNNYKIIRMVGQGQFGKVYLVQSRIQEGKYYAAKVIPFSKIKKYSKLQSLLQNQVELLSNTLIHPNIVRFITLHIEVQQIWMIYQFCQGGTLQDKLPLSQPSCINIMKQIVRGLIYAEERNVLHRDLKPANILFKKGKVKIGDWGFSRILQPQETTQSFIGSPAYMCLQALQGLQYSNKADVWSLGIMMYECLYGYCPWEGCKVDILAKTIRQKPLKFGTDKKISTYTTTIIEKMLKKNPQKRLSLRQLQKMLQNYDTLMISPSKQIRTKKINHENIFVVDLIKSLQSVCNNELTCKLTNIILYQVRMNSFEINPETQQSSVKSPKISRKYHPSINQTPIQIKLNTHRSEQIRDTSPSQELYLLHSLKSLYHQQTKNDKINNYFEYKQSIRFVINQVLSQLQSILNRLNEIQDKNNKKQGKELIKRTLINLNLILDIIMYKQMPEQYKNLTAEIYQSNLKNTKKSLLMKLLNHKMLYVNHKYCKKQ